ncbi:MAG TPA: helix-hairpin-helix domain-containing protein [Terracidiphilus sp.]|jgi:DNA uptake protein ComE-like DNA-binding protein
MKSGFACLLAVVFLAGCTTRERSPDAIRQDTAHATREAAQDAKAVAKGVVDGLKDMGTVNVNKATADDLKKLPGIDDAAARRIIDDRPYDDSYDLVKKKAVTKTEYDQIAEKITTK